MSDPLKKELFWFALLLVLLVLSGCSSSDSGPEVAVFIEGGRVTSPGSSLVVTVPEGLSVSEEEVLSLYRAALEVPGCSTADGTAVDLILLDTCLLFDRFYLFRELVPTQLDGFSSARDYVDGLRLRDPFALYLPSETFGGSLSFLAGERATVGFQFSLDEGSVSDLNPLIISNILPLSRAWFDGLQVGDRILGLDGTPLAGLSLEEVRALFPALEGQASLFSIEREGLFLDIATGAEENIGLLMGVTSDIGYLRVRQFTTLTGQRVFQDYDALVQQAGGSLDKLILDLRGNGGGSLAGSLVLSDFLIDQDLPAGTNPILTSDGSIHSNAVDYLGEFSTRNLAAPGPSNFVVLLNGNSASASEVAAAALRDYEVATLMGATSFGKGISQNVFTLVDGAGVFIPSHHLLPPSGISYHQSGIVPDILLETAPVSPQFDAQLQAAINFLETGTMPLTKGTPAPQKSLEPLDPWLEKQLREYY